jgi:hypothetical protein
MSFSFLTPDPYPTLHVKLLPDPLQHPARSHSFLNNIQVIIQPYSRKFPIVILSKPGPVGGWDGGFGFGVLVPYHIVNQDVREGLEEGLEE